MISALSGFTFAIDVSIFKFTEKKKFSLVIVKRALIMKIVSLQKEPESD